MATKISASSYISILTGHVSYFNRKKGQTCVQVIPLAQYKWESRQCTTTAKFVCSRPIGKLLAMLINIYHFLNTIYWLDVINYSFETVSPTHYTWIFVKATFGWYVVSMPKLIIALLDCSSSLALCYEGVSLGRWAIVQINHDCLYNQSICLNITRCCF